MAQERQAVQLNHIVKEVVVRKDVDGRSCVLLEDIRDAFSDFGDEFELRGAPVPYLEDEHRERLFPKRIAYYPGETLTVVPRPREDTQALLAPGALTPIASPLLSTDGSPFLGSEGASAFEETLYGLFDTHYQRMHTDQEHSTREILRELHDVQEQLSQLQLELQTSQARNEEQARENQALHLRVIELQNEALHRMTLLQTSVQAVLTQTFELHEYPSPRLFIVLPEVGSQGLNTAPILGSFASVKFRLYFLCECGLHTSPMGPHQINHIHIARHEGYEISRPTEFFRKFGPHVLRLLHVIRYGLVIAGLAIPALSAISTVDLPERLAGDLENRIEICTRFLSAYQDSMDWDAVPGIDNGEHIQNRANKRRLVMSDANTYKDTAHEGFIPLEGADLRRLGTFLDRKDQDRSLGNLFRTVDEHGHVRWICLDHYHSTYHKRQDREFESEIRQNFGRFDKHLGLVSVTLSSSESMVSFFSAMTLAGGFNELDLHLCNFVYQDLKALGDALHKTNVSKLTLTCHEYREIASMGKKKLAALIKIMNTGKIRHFHFRDIKDFIPARGIQIPKSMLAVRSLELTGIALKEGQEVFLELLLSCKNLLVLRLSEISLKSHRLGSLIKGIESCGRLTVLALRSCELSPDDAESLGLCLKSQVSLKELDLANNLLDDSGCCAIIDAVAGRLEKLQLKNTGFGDESAMALDRVVCGDRLKCLDISDSVNNLGPEGINSIARLVSRLHCAELMLPRIQEPADDHCARIVRAVDFSHLEHLEMEGSECGDLTAAVLTGKFSDPNQPCTAISTLKLAFPRITLDGAQRLLASLGDFPDTKVSFSGSKLFSRAGSDLAQVLDMFNNGCARLTALNLKDTGMADDVVFLLSKALQQTGPLNRLGSLDLSENKLTPVGGEMLLKGLHDNQVLHTLWIASSSFEHLGSMGSAVQRILETNRTLRRLSVSHVDLRELTLGLSANANTLRSIKVQHINGQVDDIFAFGDFLKSDRNSLLRLAMKHARTCDSEPALKHLSQCLKRNKTILDLQWEFEVGYEADSDILREHLERNRSEWRKRPGTRAEDLATAGIDQYTARAIRGGVE
ncbi:RNA-DNA hybrid ribonuclease [Mortierella alpina]|nr:RNA-DNA hybrid ribonuclease [Mortierella alpina]